MPDTKGSALPALTNPTDDDKLVTVDDPGGTPVSKAVTFLNAWANYVKAKADAVYSALGHGHDIAEITGQVTTGKLANKAVTAGKMEDIPATTMVGNPTGVAAERQYMSAAATRLLVNVEDGATADQTGAEIKALYEAESDTNALTNARRDKIDALETAAINHYRAPLQDLTALVALSFANLADKERRYVEDEEAAYFWDAQAVAGAAEPTDKPNPGVDPGYWRNPMEEGFADTLAAALAAVPGKTMVPVLAASLIPNTTAGAAEGTAETTTNKVMLATLDFDPATDESAQLVFPMPKSWNEGAITARFRWTAGATGDVVWGVQAQAISNDDPVDGAFGTAQTVTDSVTAANDLMISAETSAVTIAGAPAEGDLVVFRFYRDADNGSDTLAADAQLIAVDLFITTNAVNDA